MSSRNTQYRVTHGLCILTLSIATGCVAGGGSDTDFADSGSQAPDTQEADAGAPEAESDAGEPGPDTDPGGPTLDEPFHMPTMTDTSTLDIAVVEDWHIDTIDGTTRQKLINIHVDDWWEGAEIRVPVRLIVPLEGTVSGFVITGSSIEDTGEGDRAIDASRRVALDGGVGVVMTKIKPLRDYDDLPSTEEVSARFFENLDWRYSEVFLWSAIMMRAITAAFNDDLFEAGPVIAHGSSKNGVTPLVSAIQDERITGVRATVAFTALTPIRNNDPTAVAAVTDANEDFAAAREDGLPEGDQPWNYYGKAYSRGLLELAQEAGWTEDDLQASLDRIADDWYVSENWDALKSRGVDIFSLPGSHDWVAYDVPTSSAMLPDLRTYVRPNAGHGRVGHPESPSDEVDAAFFAEHLFGADGGLEVPLIDAEINGDNLEVTVTFPEGGVPEDSRIFWLYDRGPDGSAWYLYDLFGDDDWAMMAGSGSAWTASIPLEAGHTTIDLVTTHTVTVDDRIIPISAPYTRVQLP